MKKINHQENDLITFNNEKKTQSTDIDIKPSQVTISSSELFENTINILSERAQQLGSWNLVSIKEEGASYYGISGGLAGIGLQMLEARDMDASSINASMNDMLINFAKEIAADLETQATIINGTHAIWDVSNNLPFVDLGFDFGLAGISYFYTQLYNQTANVNYRQTAEKILVTIADLANFTDGLHWRSEINDAIPSIFWYDPLDFSYTEDLGPVTFSGLSLGTAGVAKTALSYLRDTDDQDNTIAELLLNNSLTYLNNQKIVNGTELSFNTIQELPELKTTNIANGVPGIATLYLDYFEYSGNSSYLDDVEDIFNWLNGSVADDQRLFATYEFNGTLDPDIELGISHGIAGISKFLLKLFHSTDNQTYLTIAKNLLDFINPFKIESPSEIYFSERIINGNARQQGSNSRLFGTGGIFEVTYAIWQELTTESLEEDVVKMKNFLVSQISTENGKSSILTFRTGKLENNPSIGLPSFLNLLLLRSNGKLLVEQTILQFGETEIGLESNLNFKLFNTGEGDLSISTSFATEDVFIISNPVTNLGNNEIYNLNIQFTPTAEVNYENTLTISTDKDSFDVLLQGSGFDNPTIEIDTLFQNNTVFTKSSEFVFDLTVSDLSLIEFVSANLDNAGSELTSQTNQYTYELKTGSLTNGTHSLIFNARDISGHQSSVSYFFTVIRDNPPIEDKIFSNQTLGILIGLSVVLIGLGIFVTRKYMN